MKFLADFKNFAFKGNVLDLAVGVVIGSAFGKIISALVSDVVMPVVSLFMPTGDWRAHGLVLRQAANPQDNVILRYGEFAGAVVDFLIVALILFVAVAKVIKAAENKLSLPTEPQTPQRKPCPACFEDNHPQAQRCRACTSSLV